MLPGAIQRFWTSLLPNLSKLNNGNYLNSSPFFKQGSHHPLSQYSTRKYILIVLVSSQGLLYIVPLVNHYALQPLLNTLKEIVLAPVYTAKGIVYDLPKYFFNF